MPKLSPLPAEVQRDLFPEELDDLEELERWLPIPGWPGYEVSDWGRVQSYWNKKGLPRGRQGIGLTPKLMTLTVTSGNRTKHLKVGLYGYSGSKSCKRTSLVHILVLEAFVGPRPRGMEACHNDGNPANNRLENLRWDTPRSNSLDAIKHGVNRAQKLREDDIPAIWARLVAGETIGSIAVNYNVSTGPITAIKSGVHWSHITRTLPGWPLMATDRNFRQPIFIHPRYADTDREIWKAVPDWPRYQVSNFGEIRFRWKRRSSYSRDIQRPTGLWREVRPYKMKSGHLRFNIYGESGPGKLMLVHQCVLLAFAGPCPPGMIACHEDDDPSNNHARNLRWDTYSGNLKDRYRRAKA